MKNSRFTHASRQITKFISQIWQHYHAIGGNQQAAALAFTYILSLVPLVTIGFASLSIFPFFKQLSTQIQNFIFSHFVAATGNVVKEYFTQFVSKALELSTISLLFLLITAISMIFSMENAMNDIWKVKKSRHWLLATLLYLVILMTSPLLLGTGFVISSYLSTINVTNQLTLLAIVKPILWLTPFILSIATFLIIYMVLPHCKVPFRAALIGAITAAILFESAKHLFSLYITYFADYQLLYGALAAIPIFLLWVYISWIITLLGAVVGYVFAGFTITITE